MARPLRIEFEGAVYHVTGRGNRQERVFEDESDHGRFLGLLEESLPRYEVLLHGFVLMGNHYHLLAQTQRANLRRWMHWLVTSYTVAFNRRHRRVGHLFQGRYKSIVVERGEYLLELSRYLHLNPVRGKRLGMGDPMQRRRRLREWPWSSYRGYAGLDKQFALVSEDLVLGEFAGPVKARRVRYRRFVEAGLIEKLSNPLEATKWQSVLGGESFTRRMRDRLLERPEARREVTAIRREVAVGPRRLREILREVGRVYGLSAREVREQTGRSQEAKGVAMTLAWNLGGFTFRELGAEFGGLDYAAAAQQVTRTRRRAASSQLRVDLAAMQKQLSRI